MKNKIILFTFLLSNLIGFSQNDNVTIIYTGNREVDKAYRITENPKMIDTTLALGATEYPLLILQYKAPIRLDSIQPATIKIDPKLEQLYHTYAKLGVGNFMMPMGEFYFDGNRSRKFNYGTHLKHISSFSSIDGYAPSLYDRSTGSIFGTINEKNYTLKGKVDYSNKGFHYYGVENDSIARDSIAQRYSDVNSYFEFASHEKDSAHLNYKIGLTYNNFLSQKPYIDSLSKWRGQENYIALNSTFSYLQGKEIFAADFDVKFNNYQYGYADSVLNQIDTGIIRNNTIVSLKPTITSFAYQNKLKAQIGVNLTVDAGTVNQFSVFPIAEAKYSFFNDLFIPFASITGGVKQNRFKVMANENEFVLPNLILENERTPIDLRFGIKGTLAKRIGFNVNARFARVQNKALFVTDTMSSLRNKFNVIYDTMNITTFEGSIYYQLNEKLKIDAVGRYFSYELNNHAYAWNLPQYQIITRGSYNLFDKLIMNLDVTFEGGRKALVYTKIDNNTVLENNQYAQNLGFIADANINLEYRYNKRLSAFLQLNNFAAQRYKRWYNMPVQGFQVLGGLTFRF